MLRGSLLLASFASACTFQVGGIPGGDAARDDSPRGDGDPDGPAISGAFRKRIAIDGSKLLGTHADFPMWVALVDPDLAARATASGSDLHFTAPDGAPLDHELATWDRPTGTLGAWVRLPSLAQAEPPTIYVVYGDPARAVAPNPAAVFASGFAAVWHLDDALTDSTIADATGTRAGTATGLAPGARTTGQLGAGVAFDGAGSISFTNPLTGNTPHTISLWVDQPAVTERSAILAVGTAAANQARWLYGHYSSATLACGLYGNDWSPGLDLDGAGWTHLVWVFEGANGVHHLYRDGAPISGSPRTLSGAATSGTTGVIGAGLPGFVTPNGMVGALDEIRIATVARSAGWIAVEHANQRSPSTFYAVGPEQSIP